MGICDAKEKKNAKMNEKNNENIFQRAMNQFQNDNNYNEINKKLNRTQINIHNEDNNGFKKRGINKLSNNNIHESSNINNSNQNNFNNRININNGDQATFRVKKEINNNLDSNNNVNHNSNIINNRNNSYNNVNQSNLNNPNKNAINIINQNNNNNNNNNVIYSQSFRQNGNHIKIEIQQRQGQNGNIQTININQSNTINNKNSPQQNQSLNSNSGSRTNDFWHRIDSRNSQNLNNRNGINNNNNNNNMDFDLFDQFFEDDFFDDFFNDSNEHLSPSPINTNHMQIRINNINNSQNTGHLFLISSSGIQHHEFRNNYLSNFNRQFLNEISRMLSDTENERGQSAHPPANQNAINKLKRFPLAEKHCKKNNGKMDLPNCCICQNEIELGNETVLLPCGHMYHWECCLQWLKTKNTCPICRFEIK